MKFLSLNSPFVRFMSKVADLMWLNVLTAICCIPILTAGAALTALHYVSLKLIRNEEGYVTKEFFKSFKRNFKQATLIWIVVLFIALMLAGNIYILLTETVKLPTVFLVVIVAAAVILLFTATFVFPLLAKFDNTTKATVKNAFIISIVKFPKTLTMIVMNILPALLLASFYDMIPVVILFGISLPALGNAYVYNKFFEEMEEQSKEANPPKKDEESEEDDVRIFKDEIV